MRSSLAATFSRALVRAGGDALFRYLNRGRLLVVMYHGVTGAPFDPPVWTQLPQEDFRRQLLFLRDHYRMVGLPEVVAACSGGSLPERAALVTFDDGLRNNFTTAFPVLRELGVPAAVFLPVDLIGTGRILWFDELYQLIVTAARADLPLALPDGAAREEYRAGRAWEAYVLTVEKLKRAGEAARDEVMATLRRLVPLKRSDFPADFDLLDWDEAREMQRSGLVGFGVHTATHRILTELGEDALERELLLPRTRFCRELGHEAEVFCYPNGRPGLDYLPEHQRFLRDCGYRCAFTTENSLFAWGGGDPLGIGRVAAGNDASSEENFFRLKTSGALHLRAEARRLAVRLTRSLSPETAGQGSKGWGRSWSL
ncbi:polysaccharide deacetylase [Geomonas sp. Red276]